MRAADDFVNRGEWVRCAAILIVMANLSVAAQAPPDLSGRWVLEPGQESPSDAPRALSVRHSLVRTMERGPMKPFFRDLTIERDFESGIRSETYQIGVTGERIPAVGVDATPNLHLTDQLVQWQGHSRVIERGSNPSGTPGSDVRAERREVWAVEPDGRLKLSITTRTSVDPPKTATFMYRRQGAPERRRVPRARAEVE